MEQDVHDAASAAVRPQVAAVPRWNVVDAAAAAAAAAVDVVMSQFVDDDASPLALIVLQ